MNWFWIAIVGPILWSVGNHIDKILLAKYFKSAGVGALFVYSAAFSGFALPFIVWIEPDVLGGRIFPIIILILSGVLTAVALALYLYALNDSEATIVVPFFQLIPVFSFIFAYLLLGETLTPTQAIAGLIIIGGAIILSFELDEYDNKRYSIKWKFLLAMIGSACFFALYEVFFKMAAIEENFWHAAFWNNLGIFAIGLLLMIFSKKVRNNFLNIIKNHKLNIFGLNLLNEMLALVGNMFVAFATLLAPIALVGLTNAYQPIFVFIGGLILTIYFPHITTERITGRHLYQKVLAIGVIFAGSYLLF